MGLSATKYSFTVTVMFGDTPATTLIDSGSTATFVSPNIANKIQCNLSPTRKRKIVVANGGVLWTEFMAKQCSYTIQGTQFTSDFRVLQLQSYDVILGADWMKAHSPVELDSEEMLVKITMQGGKKVIF